MKKILILSYYFPPCSLTAAQRIGSWEKYLPEFGFYPIVVTRNWTGEELLEEQRLTNSGETPCVVKKENSEIHFLPYKSTLRDLAFINRNNFRLFKYISKFLTVLTAFLNLFFIRTMRFKNLYYYTDQLLSTDKSISLLITSVDPFEQFFMAYLLKKRHPEVKWIADYRDEWTTSEIDSFLFPKIQQRCEQKWLSNCSTITANTSYATNKLSVFHNKKAHKLINGFDFEKNETTYSKDKSSITIVHNGTLYPTQDISFFSNALKQVNIPEDFTLILKFPGVKHFPVVANKLNNMLRDIPRTKVIMSDRISKKEVLEIQNEADLLLMFPHKGKKGIIGSKLYEYIGLRKPILLCPSDFDELEETISNSGLGVIVNTKEDLVDFFHTFIAAKQKGDLIEKKANESYIHTLTRKEQVSLLSNILRSL